MILNGVVQNEMNDLLSFPNEEDHTTANFEMPKGNVTVRAVYEAVDPVEPPVDPVDPVDPVGPVDPVLPGVIIGGAVILGAYETGTGIYRLMNMQGLPLPSDRIELAELVWERADKPEPQNMTDENLYADIDADDTDAQKAAHWMVEQELMKFDEDNNKFHPCFPVSKLRVCLTWQNANTKSPACSHQVTFGFKCVPAKYSFPGTPYSFGEETNACQTKRLTPEQKIRSRIPFKSLGDRSHWGPILVGPSASTNLFPFVCATQALCLTDSLAPSDAT